MENEQTKRVDKIAARILHNLEQMKPEDRPAYMQKLIGFLDWQQLTLLEFAVDMSPEQGSDTDAEN